MKPYMVVNDGHSGFFIVQYECERSWALALAALEQGAMDDCETIGFVHDLILGLHQGMTVDREADVDGYGYGGAHGRHCSVPRLFSRLRAVVRLLARDRSHPAWCVGQVFIWDLLVKYASGVLAEVQELFRRRMLDDAFGLPRRRSDRGLAGGGEPDDSSRSTASAATGTIEEGGKEDNGPVRGGTLVVGDARKGGKTNALRQPPPEAAAAAATPSAAAPPADGENKVHSATVRRQLGTGTRTGGSSLPSPGIEATSVAGGDGTEAVPRAASATAIVTDDESRGDGRTAVAAAAAAAAAPSAASAALLSSKDDREATESSACARLRGVTTDMEVAYGEVKEHMQWHAKRAVSGAEQATEAFQVLRAMRDCILPVLCECRAQLAWDADNI